MRNWLLILVAVGALSAGNAQLALAQQSTSASTVQVAPGGPDLKTTLQKGLKARRPVEFAFLADVAARVEDGRLPKSLVDSTFLWARHKHAYPFPYFERGLRVRARKLGIAL